MGSDHQESASPTKPASTAVLKPASEPRRLNTRALILMLLIVGVSVPGVIALRYWQTSAQRSSLLKQAREFWTKKDPARALTYLNRYLEQVPQSADGLGLKAEILSETVVTPEQASAALAVNDQAIRALGTSANLPMKRRSVELNLRTGKYQTAITQAREILGESVNGTPGKDEPGDSKTHRLLALAMYLSDKTGQDQANSKEVIRQLELATVADPNDIATALDLSQVYSTRSGLPKAQALAKSDEILQRIVTTHPKSVEVRLTRFKLFMDNDLLDRALSDAKASVEIAPENIQCRLALSEVLRVSGNHLGAMAQIDAIPVTERDRPEVRLARGLAEMTSNKMDRAVEEWRQGLVKSGGTDGETTWRLAFVLLNLGRVSEAEPLIEQFKRLSGSAEASPEALFLDSVKEMRQGRFDESVLKMESIRDKLSPALISQANYMLGQCYQAKGNSAQAIESYRRSTKSSNRWPAPWLALAEQAIGSGNINIAITELTQGLTAMPGDQTLMLAQARLAWRVQVMKPVSQRDYTNVDKMIRRLEEINPNANGLALFKAEYLSVRGNLQQAIESLTASAKKQPDNMTVWISLANGLVRAGKFKEARDAINQAKKNVGDKADLRLTMSKIASAQGDENLARSALSDQIGKIPSGDQALVYKALGDLLIRQRDTTGATEAYESWAKLQSKDPAPAMALLQVALSGTDEALIRRRVDALKGLDAKDVNWRLARIQELLRMPLEDQQNTDKITARLNEALTFANTIIDSGTSQAQGLVLRAAVQERRGKVDEATADLRRAIDLEGGTPALRPLCQLLARVGKFAEIEQLRAKLQSLPANIDQMVAEIAVQTGKADVAKTIADRIMEANPEDLSNHIWYARIQSSMGQSVIAEESLRKYAERRGTEASPWIALLVYQTQKLNREGASATLKVIRERVKSDKADLMLAQAYDVAGLTTEADTHYKNALRLFPEDSVTSQTALTFYTKIGQRSEMENILRATLKQNPNLNWAKRRLALSLSERISDENAWNEAFQLVSTGSENENSNDPIQDRLVRAIVLARSVDIKRREMAVADLEKLIPTLSDPTMAHEVLARIYSDDPSKLQLARTHAEASTINGTGSMELSEFCVDLAMRLKDIPMAEKYLSRMNRIDPGSLRVVKLKARVLSANGKSQESANLILQQLERLKIASNLDPQRETETITLARSLTQQMVLMGPFDQVEPSLRRVIALWPRLSHLLSPSLASLGRDEEAVAMLNQGADKGDLKESALTAVSLAGIRPPKPLIVKSADQIITRALEKSPNQMDLMQALAFLKHSQGNYQAEVLIYDKIRDSNTKDFRYLNNQAWTLAENLHQYDNALKVINLAIAKSGRRPAFLDTRGVILTRMGRYADAIADLEAARDAGDIIVDGQPMAAIQFHLARAYLLSKDLPNSKKAFETGLKLGLDQNLVEPSELDDYRKLTASL